MASIMDKNKNGVDDTVVAPPAGGDQATVPSSPTEQDLVGQLALKEKELEKVRSERDNYKTGLLKAKGKIAGDEEIDNIELMRQIAKEESLTILEERLTADRQAIINKALKENAELKLALKNKNGTPPASIGVHSESQNVQDGIVTPEQVASLKARGWDDAKFEAYKKNLRKKI